MQAAEALFDQRRLREALKLAYAVINRESELLEESGIDVVVRAYTLGSRALMLLNEQNELSALWSRILELGEHGLAVLEGLATRFADHPSQRPALVFMLGSRATVLDSLGRSDEARQAVAELVESFADDQDPHIRTLVTRFLADDADDRPPPHRQ